MCACRRIRYGRQISRGRNGCRTPHRLNAKRVAVSLTLRSAQVAYQSTLIAGPGVPGVPRFRPCPPPAADVDVGAAPVGPGGSETTRRHASSAEPRPPSPGPFGLRNSRRLTRPSGSPDTLQRRLSTPYTRGSASAVHATYSNRWTRCSLTRRGTRVRAGSSRKRSPARTMVKPVTITGAAESAYLTASAAGRSSRRADRDGMGFTGVSQSEAEVDV